LERRSGVEIHRGKPGDFSCDTDKVGWQKIFIYLDHAGLAYAAKRALVAEDVKITHVTPTGARLIASTYAPMGHRPFDASHRHTCYRR